MDEQEIKELISKTLFKLELKVEDRTVGVSTDRYVVLYFGKQKLSEVIVSTDEWYNE